MLYSPAHLIKSCAVCVLCVLSHGAEDMREVLSDRRRSQQVSPPPPLTTTPSPVSHPLGTHTSLTDRSGCVALGSLSVHGVCALLYAASATGCVYVPSVLLICFACVPLLPLNGCCSSIVMKTRSTPTSNSGDGYTKTTMTDARVKTQKTLPIFSHPPLHSFIKAGQMKDWGLYPSLPHLSSQQLFRSCRLLTALVRKHARFPGGLMVVPGLFLFYVCVRLS